MGADVPRMPELPEPPAIVQPMPRRAEVKPAPVPPKPLGPCMVTVKPGARVIGLGQPRGVMDYTGHQKPKPGPVRLSGIVRLGDGTVLVWRAMDNAYLASDVTMQGGCNVPVDDWSSTTRIDPWHWNNP